MNILTMIEQTKYRAERLLEQLRTHLVKGDCLAELHVLGTGQNM